jgi:hypothetical protein
MTLTDLYRIAAQIDSASFEAAEDGQLAHAHELHEIAERIRRDADWGRAPDLAAEVLALREERERLRQTLQEIADWTWNVRSSEEALDGIQDTARAALSQEPQL